MKNIKFEPTDDIIDICQDNVFKAVFTKDTAESRLALSKLISCLIGRELAVTLIVANEPPIDNLRDRQIRFDINCKAEDGKLVNVEMTMNPDDFEPVRLEFYAGKLFTGQDIREQDKTFDDLKRTYQITFLVNKSFFKNDDEIVHTFKYYDSTNNVSLGGRSQIITVELNKLDKIIDKAVEKMTATEHWSIFLRYITDTTKREKINEILKVEEGIAMAGEVLMSISKDEIERARLMSEYKYVVDTQSQLVQAKRIGRKEGREEGRNELLDLLKNGTSPDEIIKLYNKK